MKSHFFIVFLLVCAVGLSANAGNTNNDPKQQQEQKKTVKPKYDFNIFKFFSIPLPQVDSLKPSNNTQQKSFFTFSSTQPVYNKKKLILAI
ncbi:MAG: hypothetical protein KDD41_07710 [Flavobacteriales bacterium]|nr:hypothetical protein [Flavobacteriales bacterium]